MKDKINSVIILFIAFILGGLTMYYFSNNTVPNQNRYLSSTKIEETNLEKAIDKIYDATTFIKVYKNKKMLGTGSGFIYKKDNKYAYVITNHHVIADSDSVEIYINNSDKIDGKVLGSDEYLDLAVIRIDKEKVKQVSVLGNSEKCKLGEKVFTIGSPLGEKFIGTVTDGIISGINRLVEVSINNSSNDYVMEVIQTNTAVNPGNSGGPLINMNGEVIGVISSKYVEDSIEGMGFAIPIEVVTKNLIKLENGVKLERPLLGIAMYNATDLSYIKDEGIKLDKEFDNGVVVVEITENSNASKSDLQKGDVIIKIDNKDIENTAYMKYLLYKYEIGDTIELTYYRNGKYNKTKINLAK